jgi:hypothetical protein
MTMLLFSCLRAAGTMRIYVEVPRFDVKTRDFYATLGFMPQGNLTPLVPGALPSTPVDSSNGVSSDESELICMARNF